MEIIKCVICGSNKNKDIIKAKDLFYFSSGEEFHYVRCKNCGHIFLNPRPTKEEIGKYYLNSYPVFNVHFKNEKPKKNYHFLKQKIKKVLDKIYTYGENLDHLIYTSSIDSPNKSKVLDIGCASGEFLERVKELGIEGVGIEPSKVAVNNAINKGLKVFLGDPENIENIKLPYNKYDFIRMNHVFEHIHNPDIAIKKMVPFLKPNGKILIVIPNANSYLRFLFNKYWFSLQPPLHIHHYKYSTFKKLIEPSNLKIEKVEYSLLPNAFYASMYLFTNFALLKKSIPLTEFVEKSLAFGNRFFNLFIILLLIPLNFLGFGNTLAIILSKKVAL